MELDIFEALSDGFERTVQKNGLMLAGLYFIVGLVSTSSSQTVLKGLEIAGGAGMTGSSSALALPIPTAAAGVITVVASVASLVLTIVALRTFVSSETDTIREEAYTRNMLMATLNLIVGGLAFALIVGLGLIALVIPGIFLLVALYFWNVFVVVEDENFIEGLKSSWELTDGNRLRLFALGFIVVVATGIFSSFAGLPSLAGMTLLGSILSQAAGALTGVFTIATTAQAYNQLK